MDASRRNLKEYYYHGLLKNNRKTVGIRVPNNPIVTELIEGLGSPIMSTSIKNIGDEITPYPTDPYDIFELYKNLVDLVIDGGPGGNIPSTVVDCTGNDPEVTRPGLQELYY